MTREWGGRGNSYTGGSTEGWRKGTRISYKALLSGWVAEVAIVLRFDSARWTCLTFNRCVFADDDAKAKERPANGDNNIVTLSSCLDDILLLPIVPSFLPLFTPRRDAFLPLRSSSSPVLFLHRSPHPPILSNVMAVQRNLRYGNFNRVELKLNVKSCATDFINYYSYIYKIFLDLKLVFEKIDHFLSNNQTRKSLNNVSIMGKSLFTQLILAFHDIVELVKSLITAIRNTE